MNLGAENNRFDTGYFKDLDVENGIMGGGGVKQTTLYTWDGTTVSTGSAVAQQKTIYLSEDADKFDYLVVTASANDIKRHSSVVIDCHSIDWSNFSQYYINYGDTNGSDFYFLLFYVNIDSNKKKCMFFLEGKSSVYTSVHIQSVVGIKYIDSDIKNATSLDETLLYSGNDPITATTGSIIYTLSDDISNFDYILVTIYGINSDTTQSVNVFAKVPVADTYGFDFNTQGHASYINSYGGWFVLLNNQIEFALRYRGENISSVSISSVIGIKKNSLSTADIAYMAMPSDVNVTIPDVIDDSTYTATANGLVLVQAIPSSSSFASVYIRTLDSSSNIIRTSRNINYGSTGSIFCSHMVAKGDTIGFSLVDCIASSVKFFYSVGDAKALGLI